MDSFQARAMIFDLDGVLVDSEPLFTKALNRVLEGVAASPLSEGENRSLIGSTVEHTWGTIMEMRALSQPMDYYLQRYDQVIPEIFEEELVLQPGAMRLVEKVRARRLPLGLATSSRRRWVDMKLRVTGLDEMFDAVITGDEVEHGKPAPDIYLQTASRLRVAPEQCLAIEDSPSGVTAAVAAGMYTVAVRTESTVGLNINHAQRIIDSLEKFDMNLLGSSILSGNGTQSKKSR
jgi:HAD superfamily hydrolase (TIGR01509 family)